MKCSKFYNVSYDLVANKVKEGEEKKNEKNIRSRHGNMILKMKQDIRNSY